MWRYAWLIALACCGPRGSFDTVASVTVSTASCATEATVTKIHRWAYQIAACGRISYARCWFQPDSDHHTQCCAPVSEDEARNARPGIDEGPGTVCKDFDD